MKKHLVFATPLMLSAVLVSSPLTRTINGQNNAGAQTTSTQSSTSTQTAKASTTPKPRESQMSVAATKLGPTYIKIVYSQPSKKGRQIFGSASGPKALVPYGQVWRTGANEATEITLTGDVRMGGQLVKAGTYTLFTVPQADKWTVVLNSELGQWGAFKYDQSKDVLRFDVPVSTATEPTEMFTIKFDKPTAAGTNLHMMWDTVKITVPVQPAAA